MDTVSIKNKIILIAGGGGLIGTCFVDKILSCGGTVIAADYNSEQLSNTFSDHLVKYSSSLELTKIDITDPKSILEVLTVVKNKYGAVDAAINIAYPRNQNYGNLLETVTYVDFCENLSMHLGGYFLFAQQCCIVFKKQGYGNLINMSSIYGMMNPRFDIYKNTTMTMPVEYSAIKSGIIHLTGYFAQYYKKYGIRINCISPGGILDGQPESFIDNYNQYCASKGMLNPEDLLSTLFHLLSDSSKFITGQNLIVDDGFSL